MAGQRESVKVVLVTQEQCAYCEQAKELLARLASEYPIDVARHDLASAEGQTLAAGSGLLFPPCIFLDGEAFSYGRPSEKKLRRELERRTGHRSGAPSR